MNQAVKDINEAINSNDEEALTLALSNRAARLSAITKENRSWYLKMLEEKRRIKEQVCSSTSVVYQTALGLSLDL